MNINNIILDPANSAFYSYSNIDTLLACKDKETLLTVAKLDGNDPESISIIATLRDQYSGDDSDDSHYPSLSMYSKLNLLISHINSYTTTNVGLLEGFYECPLDPEFYTIDNFNILFSNRDKIKDIYPELIKYCSANKQSIESMYLDLIDKETVVKNTDVLCCVKALDIELSLKS